MINFKYIILLILVTSCGGIKNIQKIFEKPVNVKVSESKSNTPQLAAEPVDQVTEAKIEEVKVEVEKVEVIKAISNSKKVKKYCRKIDKKFLHWGWGELGCKKNQWHHVRDSFLGNPLVWLVYGDEEENKIENKNTTMIFCGVHGDEISPIKFCFDIVKYLNEQDPGVFKDKLVVLAPIVNPDSFFRKRPTRTNYRGVDINRNFPTKDWNKSALRLWKTRYRKDKRRFPGNKPLSEHETIFQVNLIKRYNPDKIISVHAPLTLIDYDGPVVQRVEGQEYTHDHGNSLLQKMSSEAKGYKIKDYPFFPGSLGNYSGNERGIPTYTLELPNTDNRKHKVFWKLFKGSIHTAIFHDFRKKVEIVKTEVKL